MDIWEFYFNLKVGNTFEIMITKKFLLTLIPLFIFVPSRSQKIRSLSGFSLEVNSGESVETSDPVAYSYMARIEKKTGGLTNFVQVSIQDTVFSGWF